MIGWVVLFSAWKSNLLQDAELTFTVNQQDFLGIDYFLLDFAGNF